MVPDAGPIARKYRANRRRMSAGRPSNRQLPVQNVAVLGCNRLSDETDHAGMAQGPSATAGCSDRITDRVDATPSIGKSLTGPDLRRRTRQTVPVTAFIARPGIAPEVLELRRPGRAVNRLGRIDSRQASPPIQLRLDVEPVYRASRRFGGAHGAAYPLARWSVLALAFWSVMSTTESIHGKQPFSSNELTKCAVDVLHTRIAASTLGTTPTAFVSAA